MQAPLKTCLASDFIQCGQPHTDDEPSPDETCPGRSLIGNPTRTYRLTYIDEVGGHLYEDPDFTREIQYPTGAPITYVPCPLATDQRRRAVHDVNLRHQWSQMRIRQKDAKLAEAKRTKERFGPLASMSEPVRRTESASFTAVLHDPRQGNAKILATIKAQRLATLWRRMDAAFFFPARDAYDQAIKQIDRAHPDDDRSALPNLDNVESWMAPGMARCWYTAERADRSTGQRHPFRIYGHIHSKRWEERHIDDGQRFNFRVSPEIIIGIRSTDHVYMHVVRDRITDPDNPRLGMGLACPISRFQLGAWLSERRHRLPPFFRLTDEFTDVRIRETIEATTIAAGTAPTIFSFRRRGESFAWLGFYKHPGADQYEYYDRWSLRQERRIKFNRERREIEQAMNPDAGPPPSAPDLAQAEPLGVEEFYSTMLSSLEYSRREDDLAQLLRYSSAVTPYTAHRDQSAITAICDRMYLDWRVHDGRMILYDFAFEPSRHPSMNPSLGAKYRAPTFADYPNGFYVVEKTTRSER